ncbi:Pyruvate/2-oxoglutarate dehydrogenase complex, dihydrolipoamide acyltransferase component [Syntrophobacter sp. SbD1]|nr:Pyruvate/2-oxoglutarate dehydrogenase complex, dihydrolipoamide acyltransferase component [Syntrophobacter sp. SbD1]
MSVKVSMPKLGMTMRTGKLSKWFKNEGDQVGAGEELFEVETEKITNKVEAPVGGILFQIVVREGAVVPIGTIVGVIAEPGEIPERIEGIEVGEIAEPTPAPVAAASGTEAEGPVERGEILATPASKRLAKELVVDLTTPASKRLAKELVVDLTLVKGTGPDGRIREADVTRYHEQALRKPRITPLAEEIARKASLDISVISGTGEGGKITREDVERALQERKPAAVEEKKPALTIPMTGMRKAIADNMFASLHNTAQLSLASEVDVTESLRFVALVQEQHKKDESVRVSLNDIVIMATSRALKRFPIMNSTQVGSEIILHDSVAMGIAVAIPEGLIVPVLRDADRKGLLQIAGEARVLIGKARSNSLSMDDVTGGTFTITNLSASRVDNFTPILRPPETGILGIGRVVKKPVVFEGEIVIRSLMGLSLTFDHRVVDGSPASVFFDLLCSYLEQPTLILT